MQERRFVSRSLCSEIVKIVWNDADGWPRSSTAILEDISPGGASIQLDVAVPISTNVTLRLGDMSIPCEVRYRAFRQIGFFLGVEFTNGYRWSRRRFQPKHLL